MAGLRWALTAVNLDPGRVSKQGRSSAPHCLAGAHREATFIPHPVRRGRRTRWGTDLASYFIDQNPIATPPGAATIAMKPMPSGSACGLSISVAPAAIALL